VERLLVFVAGVTALAISRGTGASSRWRPPGIGRSALISLGRAAFVDATTGGCI